MKKLIYLLFTCLFMTKLISQNLVPNYSFEVHSNCPNGTSGISLHFATSWDGWDSSDYFSYCATDSQYSVPQNIVGYQQARTDTSYAGILLDVNYDDIEATTRAMFAEENTTYPDSDLFKLYPNPNDGNMLLDYSLLNENDKAELSIYDITGKLLYKYELDSSDNQLSISHKGLNNGIYLYKIKVNEQIVKSSKLIIIK